VKPNRSYWLLIALALLILIVVLNRLFTSPATPQPSSGQITAKSPAEYQWQAPDENSIPATPEGDLIHYGKELVANTALYLGPKGKVASITNGLNCQNCHIKAGMQLFGNSFSAVAATYPRYRHRSGIVESIEFRINDCLLRSMNGATIDSTSREMQAMVHYLKWVGKEVPKGIRPKGAGAEKLPFLERAADTALGRKVFVLKCQVCHGAKGEGVWNHEKTAYVYPPLWGNNSYNTGAGLYRLSDFAAYVKYNMPFGTLYTNPQLTNEEAWDVAAFVNSQPRPHKDFSKDWPDISKKPVDHPFGPYADTFSEQQHKYGPFGPIAANKKE
jgi:thiosulfate dehydrogenase